jgi:hypothetical protein
VHRRVFLNRHTATDADATGRVVEDEIEGVAKYLGLPCAARTRFEGRNGLTAPCDLAIPAGGAAARIVVAAKGFDSTGSKLTDAVREVEEMAEKRLPSQYVMAAVDDIGWKSRVNDLRRIHDLSRRSRSTGCIRSPRSVRSERTSRPLRSASAFCPEGVPPDRLSHPSCRVSTTGEIFCLE